MSVAARINWPPIIADARTWAAGMNPPPTLRQVFYHLVAQQAFPNEQKNYRRLSSLTAQARRDGTFPALTDETRGIVAPPAWDDPDQFATSVVSQYRLDRWAGQEHLVLFGVEKRGMTALFRAWFGGYGIPVVPLAGYSSQTLADDVAATVNADGRPAILLYAGDHDASGRDILRDFTQRADCFTSVQRFALTPEQVGEYALPENPAKSGDPRAAGFASEFGPVQVEVDALDPGVLRQLADDALAPHFDRYVYQSVVERETEQRETLAARLGVAS